MAITAETRNSIIELVVTAYDAAPGTTLLTELIAIINEGGTLADVATALTTSDLWNDTYPIFQTAEEFAAEWMGKLLAEADADTLALAEDIVVGLINDGVSAADLIMVASSFLAELDVEDELLGSSAAGFVNKVDVATYFTVTLEQDGTQEELANAIASVTSDEDSVDAAKEDAEDDDAEDTTYELTSGIDELIGNNGDNTFNAGTVNPVSGADQTTVNNGDSIDGSSGTDTLNITATADDNTSLTGLTVENVEIINITGADNLGVTSSATETDSAVAGTAPVQSIKIDASAIVLSGQTSTIDFGDFIQLGEAGDETEGFELANGETAITVEVEGEDTGADIATAVVAAITAANTAETAGWEYASASATGGLVTITYDVNTGAEDAEADELYDPGNLTISVLSADGAVDDVDGVATQVLSDLATATIVDTEPSADVTATVTIGGVETELLPITVDDEALYAELVDGDAADVEASLAERNSVAETLRDDLVTLINSNYSTLSASNGDNVGELLITSSVLGGDLPTITLTANDASLAAADSDDSQNVTGVTRTFTVGAVSEVRSLTIEGTYEAGDTFQVLIDGQDYGTVTAAGSNAASATAIAAAINTVLGDDTATSVGDRVTVTAPTEGVALPDINVIAGDAGSGDTDVAHAIVTQNAEKVGETTTVTASDASVSGSQFVGAEQVWLKGSASASTNLTVTGDQVAGLSGVTGIDGATYTLGTASTLAISGATTDAEGDGANVKGGGTTLNIIGTGSTGFTLVETNTTDKMASLAVSTSGSTVLNVAGLTALETISQSGEGGLTINGVTNDVYDIMGGAGADKLTLATATAVDNEATSADETVNASLTSGDGGDTVVVTVSGAGDTDVDSGAGNDTIKVNHTATGNVTISAGDGDDTVWLQTGTGELTAKATVDGGDGVDTLALDGDTSYTTGDYTKLGSYATGFEKLTFFGATAASGASAFDASKVPMAAYTVSTGSNYFQEVAGGTAFVNIPIVRAATDYLGAITNYGSDEVEITTADYEADTDATDDDYDANYGQDISITHSTFATAIGATTYDVYASDVSLTIASIGSSKAAESSAQDVVVTGQMETISVILASARGTKAAADNGDAEYMAEFTITTDPTPGDDAMQGLTSITVVGSGVVTIDTSYDGDDAADSTTAQLTMINLAGMTDFEDLNYLGKSQSGTFVNKSTSTITLNDEVAEEVMLGGADDTVDTNSTVEAYDTITGFSLVATAITTDDDDVIDEAVSDTLDIDTATDNSTATGGAADQFVADDNAYSSLDAALLAISVDPDDDNVVFHAEGNTYVYQDDGDNELNDADLLVELVGIYDLDQLVNAII